jgi:uncharacterized Zn-finger protein
MGVLSKLFSIRTNTAEKNTLPKNFVDCLDIVRIWNAKTKFHLDMDIDDASLQSAMNTLVTCPYCSESYYFADALGFVDANMTVECPHCHNKPNEGVEEYDVA